MLTVVISDYTRCYRGQCLKTSNSCSNDNTLCYPCLYHDTQVHATIQYILSCCSAHSNVKTEKVVIATVTNHKKIKKSNTKASPNLIKWTLKSQTCTLHNDVLLWNKRKALVHLVLPRTMEQTSQYRSWTFCPAWPTQLSQDPFHSQCSASAVAASCHLIPYTHVNQWHTAEMTIRHCIVHCQWMNKWTNKRINQRNTFILCCSQ